MKPRLYVNAGAMKAGTTWLLQLLKTNKNVMTTPVKEIDYFSHLHTDYKLLHFKMRKERIQRIISSIGEGVSNKEMADLFRWFSYYLRSDIDDMWYKNLFQDSDNIRYVADLSNTYCHLPRSGWEHIKRLDSETRITFIMRDPVQRTLSHLKFDMMFSGLTSRMESVSDNEVLRFATSKAAYDRSDYAKTISEITRVFPNQQFRYYYFEEIMRDKEQFCNDLSEFLGIKLTYYEGLSQSVNEGPQKKFSKNLIAKVREAYAPIYRDLETFLGPLPSSWDY